MPSPDIFYYNLSIGNNDIERAGDGIYTQTVANVVANNNLPICFDPSEYYCSIIRFQIPAFNIPQVQILIQVDPALGVTDINKTIYSFTLEQNGINSDQTYLIYTPDYANIPAVDIPQLGTPTQTFNSYYFCFSITTFIHMMNTALATATTSINSKGGTIAHAPYFIFDPETALISLYTDVSFDTNSGTSKLWFNNSLWNYFVGFNAVVYYAPNKSFNNALGKDNLFTITNDLGINTVNLTPSIGAPYLAIKTENQYTSFGYWAVLKNILITTSMNIVSELFFINNSNTQQNIKYVNVLTDFQPDISTTGTGSGAGVGNQIFSYDAPSLFRVFSFNQTTPLYNINLGISFQDKLDNIYPLYLDKYMSASFKFMFIKKEIFSGMNKLL